MGKLKIEHKNPVIRKAKERNVLTNEIEIILSRLAEVNCDYTLDQLRLMYIIEHNSGRGERLIEGFKKLITEIDSGVVVSYGKQ